MKDVVRASCPGCKRTLNMPAEWTGRTVRCKHCGHAMQIRAADIPTAAVAVAAPAVPMALAAAPTWEPLPASLPEFIPHAAPAALTAPLPEAPRAKYVSAFDTRDKYRGRGNYRGPKKKTWLKYVVLGTVLVLVTGLGVFGAYKAGLLTNGGTPAPGGAPETPPVAGGSGSGGEPGTQPAGTFPRRMLAISIHSYLYANPLHNGDSGYAVDESRRSGTDAAVHQLAQGLRVPKEQLYHLTDAPLLGEKKTEPKRPAKKGEMVAAPEPAKRIAKSYPLRGVIEGTVTQFVDTSREQDRLVILFCGHAVERKGKAYLVPLEGDLDEVDSLIPLDWFYEKLGSCKAQEKLVIFDVCRFNPGRGIERPSAGPMTEALETALHSPPDGVTVVTTCSKGEQSIELDELKAEVNFDTPGVKANAILLHGGFFLSMIYPASYSGVFSAEKRLPAPTDELPVERMTKWIGTKLGEAVHNHFKDLTQTVKATIKRRPEVAYNPTEPMPGRFEFPVPPPSADPRAVLAIVREVQLPPVKSFRDDAPPPSISDVLPFTEAALKDYMAGELKMGDTPNAFQKAVLEAVAGMRAQRGAGSGTELPEEFGGETSDKAKEELRKVQEVPARVGAELQDLLDDLEKVADRRDKQPKRWQVHFDYVVAQLKLRICYAGQYNLALANVRNGKLPDLKEGQNGFRLAAEPKPDKNTPSNEKEMFDEAQKALTELAKNNPNTPWALLAKSDRTVAIGLRLSGGTVARPVK